MSEREDSYKSFGISPLIKERLEFQAKTFTKWINSDLIKAGPDLQVINIFTDLRDGKKLIKLIEVISGEQLPKPSNGKMRIHFIEDVNIALGFLHTKFRVDNIGAEDIVDGNPTLTLGLIWALICRFQIEPIEVEVNGKTLKKSYEKGALLSWCQLKTFMYSDVQIRNFTSSWKSGMAFNALIDCHRRQLIDMNALRSQSNIQRLNNAFDIAEKHFGIPKLLDAEDVDTEQPDENSIITYISLFYHTFERKNKLLEEQPNNQMGAELKPISPSLPEIQQILPQSLPTLPKSFKRNFQIISELGTGGFGTVFRAEDKSNKHLFAVKKVIFSESSELDRIMREVNHLSKCSGDYVVKYFDSWIEDNCCLYIQMELCSDNLKNIIQQKPKCFERNSLEVMSCVEYFISGQLLKELVECVQYLHELKPPIIHRDLKPHNILVVSKQRNGRFLKICDFGLATEHQLLSQTMSHTGDLGTVRYMAPEVYQGVDQKSRYSTKVDIYSLGVIGQELFDFDVFSSDSRTAKDDVLREKWINLQKLTSNMMNTRYSTRPDCRQILIFLTDLCSISFIEIKNSENYEKCIKQMKNYSKDFFYEYFKEKVMF